MPGPFKVESLFAARLFLNPQVVGDRLFFLSDLSGRLSLYAMDKGGSVPEPLLPPNIALQNPALMGGYSFYVFPDWGRIIVMIDQDGDENYQPYTIPLTGGIPEPLFGERFAGKQLFLSHVDVERNVAGFNVDGRTVPDQEAYLVDLETLELTHLGTSIYGNYIGDVTPDHEKALLADSYTAGDTVLFLWERGAGERRLLYGTPLEAREPGMEVPLTGFRSMTFTPEGEGVVLTTALFDDRFGLAYFPLDDPGTLQPIAIDGTAHTGVGELDYVKHLTGDRYFIKYNIDGVSWGYVGALDVDALRFTVEETLIGEGALANGVAQSLHYEKATGVFALAFSTAISPAQLYTIEEGEIIQHTRERVLGIPQDYLSAGEDASFISHDGLRVSARLYLPAPALEYEAPYPVIFYIHGGPQGQEKPDFTWFSMPLIQFFTLNGFAVFVPNVRGSTGYGMDYMKRVDRDWGGQDRLDHVAAFEQLRADPRLDMARAGVMGRSYGGYMTLMQVAWHPDLWRAACDMFGPYNLFTFMERLPETWKTYFYIALGHPERDKDFLTERSPSTKLDQLACPMLVIQGRNDPRVVAEESIDLVQNLQAQGKDVEILVMENEGHDVLKYENKVWVYNAIVDFFKRHLSV